MHKIKEILENSSFTLLTNISTTYHDFEQVYATDLISMVIKHGKDDPILITQIDSDATLAVAMMLSLPAIIMTEDHVLPKNLIDRANDEDIAVITTSFTAVEVIIAFVRMGLL